MPIKVLVISDYVDIHSSRPEAEIYIGLAKLNFEIEIMTVPESPYIDKFEAAGIRVIKFHPKKKFDRKETSFIRETLINGKYDILHLYNSSATISGIRAAKNIRVKIVLYRGVPGHIHWYDPSLYLKYFHPRVDKIVCNSKGVEDVFHKQLFFNKNKVITINKGHKLEWYQHIKPIDRKELGIPENDFVVIFVGNNRPVKGVPYLLNAFDHIPAELPIHLLILGMDMDNEINMHIVNNSPNRERIHFLGFRKDALSVVAASDTLVLSSINLESITKSVFEAMSLGVPPIITNLPGNREFVDENKSTALVIPIKDSIAIAEAILKLYNNPEMRKEMGKNCIKHIDTKLSNKTTVIKMKALYEELLD